MKRQGKGHHQVTVIGESLSQCTADELMLELERLGWTGQGACGVPTNHMLTGKAPLGSLRARAEFLRLPSDSKFEFWYVTAPVYALGHWPLFSK